MFPGIKALVSAFQLKKSWISEQDSMISIIDDDRSVREAVKSLIRSLGYEAVTFASAEEYLGADDAHVSECIITDVQMPGMTGIDLRDRLIADGYRRPIIFMSALSAEDAGANALRTASSRFLKKPFSDEGLIDCLDRALKDSAPNTRPS
jgi:FixJ family two-component response regulator